MILARATTLVGAPIEAIEISPSAILASCVTCEKNEAAQGERQPPIPLDQLELANVQYGQRDNALLRCNF